LRFAIWMVIGFAVYFLYSAPRSRLVTDENYSRDADDAAAADRAT
jgi:hypothetical protein